MAEYEVEVLGVVLVGVFQYLRCNRNKEPFITTLYLSVSVISLFQRYLYNNHTILQLIIGLIIGTFFGYLTYITANKYIMGNIKMKKDDNFY